MDRDAARALARIVATGRIAVGVTALLSPVVVTEPWIGPLARTPGVRVFARAMGGRDIALGAGTLRALSRPGDEARTWVALGGVADTVDLLATVFSFSQLPRRRWAILAVTAGAAVASFRAATALEGPEAPVSRPVPARAAAAGNGTTPGPQRSARSASGHAAPLV
ncbi:MAG: hypothetical protein M0007_07760 [Actinomycetota bacterium]|jgi:hypothetical protein|nr:hypothetical protein [Actinomycetota bacterium]